MTYIYTLEQMVADIQEHLDIDPRYWDQDEGIVSFGEEVIAYVRLPDEYQLTIDGAKLFVPRV